MKSIHDLMCDVEVGAHAKEGLQRRWLDVSGGLDAISDCQPDRGAQSSRGGGKCSM